ncbi:MAG: folate family ECF transporter S component [Clostridiales bacterium]|nr:folate family ECF transporter S component [Clostridiales bacterium]
MTRQRRLSATEKITCTALLVAMQIVMGNLVQIPLPTKQFNFGFLPVAMAGVFLGFPWAITVGALGDFFGAQLFPSGAYFPGFTLTYALTGLVYGLMLYRKKAAWWRVAVTCVCVALINLFLNSYWLTYFIPKGYWVLVEGRLLTYLIDIPISIVVVYYVARGLGQTRLFSQAKEEEKNADPINEGEDKP